MLTPCMVIPLFQSPQSTCITLSDIATMNNKYYGKFKAYGTSDSLSKNCMMRVERIPESTNKNIIGQIFPEVLKSRSSRTILK